MNKRLWAVGNYARFVRPGWERIGATAGDTSVTAFRQAATGKFAIVAINAGTKSKDVELNLNGLSVSSVTPYTTSSTQDLATGPAIATTNGRLTVSLAPSTISTFTGKAKTTSPLAVSITESRAHTGETASATVTVINGGRSTESGSVTIVAPPGVTPNPSTARFGPLSPGASVTIPVSLVVAPNATTGTPIVEVRATRQALRRRRSGGIGLVTGLNLIRIYDTILTVIPGTGAEVPWLHDAGTSQLDGAVGGGHARFMDNTSTATYRIDLPKNVSGGAIDLDIGNSFKVDTSADNKNWTNRLAQRPL